MNGGPAFPVWELNGDGQQETTGFGMTLRDYFAAKAMASYLNCQQGRHENPEFIALSAYEIADAMLAAREKP